MQWHAISSYAQPSLAFALRWQSAKQLGSQVITCSVFLNIQSAIAVCIGLSEIARAAVFLEVSGLKSSGDVEGTRSSSDRED
jgi:hypothetical protein